MPSYLAPMRSLPARNLLAMAVYMAIVPPALADDGQPATLELGATEISSDQLGSTTEGSQSYTTGAMSTATKLPLSLQRPRRP